MSISIIPDKNSKHLSTKDKISVATFKLLSETKGLNVTISDICRAADITKSTFYYYYHSLDEVIDSFTAVLTNGLADKMPVIFQQHTCVEQALMAIKIIDEGVRDLGVSVAASRYIMHLKNADYLGFQAEAGWDLICAILKKAVEVGELPSDRSGEEIAASAYYIMRGVNTAWCMSNGSFDFPETVQEQLRIYFEALKKLKQ